VGYLRTLPPNRSCSVGWWEDEFERIHAQVLGHFCWNVVAEHFPFKKNVPFFFVYILHISLENLIFL
jgi:hypothetical protein